MKILLSAYACEPGKGSEPGVGWNWAIELAKLGHEVRVLTRANNQVIIDAALNEQVAHLNLHFHYYDLPKLLRWFKKFSKGIYFYYFFWQVGAYLKARGLVREKKFDQVHHVTFVSVRQPSFMGLLGIPFVFGPVAGGEVTPALLRASYPFQARLEEWKRDCVNAFIRFDPLMWLTFHSAEKIYVTSKQTQRLIPECFHRKCEVQLAIGSDAATGLREIHCNQDEPFRFLFVGRLIYWKGVHLALRAFAQFLQLHPLARFTIIGEGSEEGWLKDLTRVLGIAEQIDWVPWASRETVMSTYLNHDVFLFPSLHDSGGMVVLEALSHGLPVVCLDLGGPAVMVDASCGRVIDTTEKNLEQVVVGLSQALLELESNREMLMDLSQGAVRRASKFTWSSRVQGIYKEMGVKS